MLIKDLEIKQLDNSYLFTNDSFHLASYLLDVSKKTIVDFGTGVGIMPLNIAARFENVKIYGIEIQRELAQTAIYNVKKNNLTNKITILNKNIKDVKKDDFQEEVDIVISNPPYIKITDGRINPNLKIAISKHEIAIKSFELFKKASEILKDLGKFVTIYPSSRLIEIIIQMRQYKLEPKKICMIHGKPNKKAKKVIIESIKNAKEGLIVDAPIIIS